jgi:hypothetical protein
MAGFEGANPSSRFACSRRELGPTPQESGPVREEPPGRTSGLSGRPRGRCRAAASVGRWLNASKPEPGLGASSAERASLLFGEGGAKLQGEALSRGGFPGVSGYGPRAVV